MSRAWTAGRIRARTARPGRPSSELEALARTLQAGEAPRLSRPVSAVAHLAFLVPEPRQALARLIGREAELTQVRGIMQAAREGRLWSAVRTLLDAASRHHPITLILDDLHWADVETLGLLTFPARRGGDRRLFILGTSRDDLPDTHPVRTLILEGRRQGGVTRIEVPICGPDEVAILADQMLGGPLSERRAHALHARCNGNPFFATELPALLAARRAEAGERGDAIDDEVLERDEALPPTVRQTLARRLDRLGMTTRVLLRAGSLLGLHFDADLVAALAAQDRTACEDALDEVVATGLLREEPNVGGTCYVLVHSLLRRTLYEELLPGQHRRLHERAGQALAAPHETRGNPSAETIAHHFVRTNDHARAAYWLAKAGDHAATLHASAPAIQYYVQACDQFTDATGGGERPDPVRLHEGLGDLRVLEGEYEAVRENFARARALGGSAEDLASLWVKEGTAWEKSSDYDRALASFQPSGRGDREWHRG